jgi:IS5 family transposase
LAAAGAFRSGPLTEVGRERALDLATARVGTSSSAQAGVTRVRIERLLFHPTLIYAALLAANPAC